MLSKWIIPLPTFYIQAFAANESNQGSIGTLPFIILFAIAFYFFILAPQKKKTHQETIKNLKVGDDVQLHDGTVGTIANVDGKQIKLIDNKQKSAFVQRHQIKSVLNKKSQKT
ncbi:preprotein translocase subunit YajC [Gammaproteobacteria bacterium]|jgi:preprotein translocase YajC subunit|nr:preprotein translocase subunit YajC [Gammaproteobacteria bacterium]